MPSYRYRGRNRMGELIEGRVEAANTGAVAAQLIDGGVTPLGISFCSPASSTRC